MRRAWVVTSPRALTRLWSSSASLAPFFFSASCSAGCACRGRCGRRRGRTGAGGRVRRRRSAAPAPLSGVPRCGALGEWRHCNVPWQVFAERGVKSAWEPPFSRSPMRPGPRVRGRRAVVRSGWGFSPVVLVHYGPGDRVTARRTEDRPSSALLSSPVHTLRGKAGGPVLFRCRAQSRDPRRSRRSSSQWAMRSRMRRSYPWPVGS